MAADRTYRPRRRFRELTARGQRAAIKRGEAFGLIRRQTIERYDRGTFRPFARDIEDRVPLAARRNPERYPVAAAKAAANRAAREAKSERLTQLRTEVIEHSDSLLGSRSKYDPDGYAAWVGAETDPNVLASLLTIGSTDEWLELSRRQLDGNLAFYHR